jgi:hypothetical protein
VIVAEPVGDDEHQVIHTNFLGIWVPMFHSCYVTMSADVMEEEHHLVKLLFLANRDWYLQMVRSAQDCVAPLPYECRTALLEWTIFVPQLSN